MEQPIQISVAIPLYNAEKYIEKSLCSALDQDFQYSYEVVVVDDKSTDDSLNIAYRVIQSHPQRSNYPHVIEHKENLGIGETCNTIIDNVRGKYMFFSILTIQ